jgi:hypothetical protein
MDAELARLTKQQPAVKQMCVQAAQTLLQTRRQLSEPIVQVEVCHRKP